MEVGLEVNVRETGNAASGLMLSSEAGYDKVVRELLSAGARINLQVSAAAVVSSVLVTSVPIVMHCVVMYSERER